MAPPKVLFVVNSLRMGGFERDVAMLCEHVDTSRFQLEVWTLLDGGKFEGQVLRSGVRLRNLGRRWARSPLFAWKAAREISRSDADLIHAFLPTIATYGAFARMCFGVRQPMVLSIGQSSAGRSDRWMFRWCSCTFDWLIANSRSAAELGRSLGFAPGRISVIPNGHEVSPGQNVVHRERIRASLGVGTHERMLLCVARLTNTKRVCDAVTAAGLLGAGANVKLVIAGEGPERPALEEQVVKLGLSGNVVFAGQRNDVPDLLAAADIFVFPSETEGLPNALIEACLAGLPIVACNVGGVVDVVQDEQTAILVLPRRPDELAAAVRRMLSNPVEAGRLGAAAQAQAGNRYDIQHSISALYDVYDQLLGSRRRHEADISRVSGQTALEPDAGRRSTQGLLRTKAAPNVVDIT
jgi:glycosyltransferase involved in cell wall biosynthesis